MNVLLVYAHPEPRSFCGAMRDVTLQTLRAAGHDVMQSDLYAMRFDAEGGFKDFADVQDTAFFKYQREQRHAAATRTFSPEIQNEIDKVVRADLLIFLFPLWWYSLPAIMKGWVDRVFAMGFAYDAGRAHQTGPLRGRRGMCILTTGAPAPAFGDGAVNPAIEKILMPIEYGIFHVVGMDVLPRFVAFGAARISDADRANVLAELRAHLHTQMDTHAGAPSHTSPASS